MTKKIIIKHGSDCPYYSCRTEDNGCTHEDNKNGCQESGIPEWCPLEDEDNIEDVIKKIKEEAYQEGYDDCEINY